MTSLNKNNTKILFYWPVSEDLYPIPLISNQMIIFGPELNTKEYSYVKSKISVKPGPIDLEPILEIVSDLFEPDILLCWVMSDNYYIYNTSKFKGIKIFIPGDTHHMINPIRRLIDYSSKENYDIFLHGDIDAIPFFSNLNKSRHYWLKRIISDDVILSPQKKTKKQILHIGQKGKFHIKRLQYFSEFENLKFPVFQAYVNRNELHQFYNQYSMTLNITLNRDFNDRLFDVMAAGGVLLSERISQKTLGNIYSETEVPTFSDINELLLKKNQFLNNDELRYNTAKKAQRKFLNTLSQDIIHENFWNAINNKKVDCLYDYSPVLNRKKNTTVEKNLINIAIFQLVQECARVSSRLKIDFYGLTNEQLLLLDKFDLIKNDLSKLNKSKDLKLRASDSLSHDTQILITNNLKVYDLVQELNYDFIFIFGEDNFNFPVGYRYIKKEENLMILKKDHFKSQTILNEKNSMSTKNNINLGEYEELFLDKFINENFNLNRKKILLIEGSIHAHDFLIKKPCECEHLTNLNSNYTPFLSKKGSSYDIIILFDNSRNICDLTKKLVHIYGLMKSSSILVFHSARFIMGPNGWKKNPNLFDYNNNLFENPWKHLLEVYESKSEKKITTIEFEKKLNKYLLREVGEIPREIDYNENLIHKSFIENGYKIIYNFKCSNKMKSPYKLIINDFEIEHNNTGIISYLRKANWLEDDLLK